MVALFRVFIWDLLILLVFVFLIFYLLITTLFSVIILGSSYQLSIRLALTSFQDFTGLKVDVVKSEIVPIREVSNIHNLANILQCKVASLPMIYLGIPLGTMYKIASIQNLILERMEKKLSSWKWLYLSKGGILTLLKSTLSSLLTYHLSLFTVPKAMAMRLECIQKKKKFCGVLQLSASNTLWWLGKRFSYLVSQVGWEFRIWCRLIKLYQGNGFGGMAMKLLVCGEGSQP